jgi:hypothetical protein
LSDLDLAAGKSAIHLAELRKDEIEKQAIADSSKLEKVESWFEIKIDTLLSKFTNVQTIYKSKISKMVLRDVVLSIGAILA